MDFDNDIFISYAHLDNQPLMKDSEGWVSQFHRALEVRIDQLLGRKSAVWRDPKLQGNDYYEDTIVDQLPMAAVLVSVFTPRYVHSKSCTTELPHFCETLKENGGLRFHDKTRIFKVLKTPVPIEEQPEDIRDFLGYEFFKIDTVTGRVREFNQVFGQEAEREFWIRLDDLAQDLCQLLRWLEHEAPASASGTMPGPRDTVYLASCSSDVRDRYDEVKRDLLAHNYRVVPDRPLPLDSSQLKPVLRDYIKQSRMSIHIIGESYGIVPDGTDHSFVRLQNEAAMEREGDENFSRLIWIPPGLQTQDSRQQQFIEELRSDPRIQSGADLLETSFEDLNTQIHSLLAPGKGADNNGKEALTSTEVQSVYLMCDARDVKNVTPVADCLFDQGCEVVLPAFQGDEAEVRADHEENLRGADGVLIYYGAPNELWLRNKLRERRKSAGLGRTKALKATAILMAPPKSEEEQWFRTHEARVIHQPEAFSSDLLEPFLADLRS